MASHVGSTFSFFGSARQLGQNRAVQKLDTSESRHSVSVSGTLKTVSSNNSLQGLPADLRMSSDAQAPRFDKYASSASSIKRGSSSKDIPRKGKGIEFEKLLEDLSHAFNDLSAQNRLLLEEVNKQRCSLSQTFESEQSGGRLTEVLEGALEEENTDYGSDEEFGKPERNQSSFIDNTLEPELSDGVFPEWPIEKRLKQKARKAQPDHKMKLSQLPLMYWNEGHFVAIGDRCVASPVGKVRLTWDLLSFFFFALQIWLTPFTLFFLGDTQAPDYFNFLEDITTVFFALDILFNFNTGVIITTDNEEDSIVMTRSVIMREYCKGFFWIDFFSTVPFDRLMMHLQHNVNREFITSFRVLRVARWLKLLRFLRMLSTLRMLRSRASKGFELQMQRLRNYLMVPVVAVLSTVFFAHNMACAWRAMQPKELEGDPFDIYAERFMHALFAIMTGKRIDDDAAGVLWILDIFTSTLRLIIGGFGAYWLLYHAVRLLQLNANTEHVKEEILSYMGHRGISDKTQLHVLNQLHECHTVASAKRRFDIWMDSGIPSELHRSISKELWHHRLASLGLIDIVFNMQPQLVVELSLLVREEILARLNVLFKEGDMPLGAYMILDGLIYIESTFLEEQVPDFTADMWVGEKALVNPTLLRTVTAVCKTMCTLMAVPCDGFRHLLIDFEILAPFEEYCVQHLWHGICGRCGVVGDHFANDCPLNYLSDNKDVPVVQLRTTRSGRERVTHAAFSDAGISSFSLQEDQEENEVEDNDRLSCWSSPFAKKRHHNDHEGYTLLADVGPEKAVKRDLKEFLWTMDVKELLPFLERAGVRSMSDLQKFPSENVDELVEEILAQQDEDEFGKEIMLRQAFELSHIQDFRDNLEERAKEVLGTVDVRSQHLIFISHHKLDAGTEASLLRQELETLIKGDPELKKQQMDAPVFLDSEDLNDLELLQEHVRNSHNILLLMTKDVLTRPWVLVEIATAHRLGVPILPIEIRKAGLQFRYPDESFYAGLSDGTLLPRSSKKVLHACGVTPFDVENSIRKVFNRISFPYSPHRSSTLRMVEVQDFLKRCHFNDSASHLQKRRRGGAPGTQSVVDFSKQFSSSLSEPKKEPEDKTVHTVRC